MTNAGGSAGAEDAAERGALLDRAVACLGDGAPARWPLVAAAVAALMGAGAAGGDPPPDPEAAAAEARAARWWQEDAESAALQADLAELARGDFKRLQTVLSRMSSVAFDQLICAGCKHTHKHQGCASLQAFTVIKALFLPKKALYTATNVA